MQVRRHDGIQAFGMQRHPNGHGVDEHLVPGTSGNSSARFRRDLVPHHHAVSLGIRLGHDRQQLAGPRLRQLGTRSA